MITDPLTIENGTTDISAPRIVSPNQSTGRFRGEHADGSVFSFDFIQNGNTSRSRHVVRLVFNDIPNSDGTVDSVTFTLTVDEPANGAVSNTQLLYLWNTTFKGTLTDTVFGKLVNGEV